MNAAMSATRILLHIGTHKTGTSSIQDALALGRERLAAHGVLYPRLLPANHSHVLYDACAERPETYHANILLGRDRDRIAADTARTLAALAAEIAGAGTVVLSGEDASSFRPAEVAALGDLLARIAPGAAVGVLLYTRHPVEFVASAVQENVKGNALTLARAKEIHIGTTANRYRRIVEAYADVFGAAAVTVRAFETARRTGLVADLLARLALPGDLLPDLKRNERIADEVVRFLSERTAARLPPLDAASLAALRALPGSRGTLLTAEERETVWTLAASDIAFLKERFGILYERLPEGAAEPGDGTAGDAPGRLAFLDTLAAALPDLSPAARTALVRHLAGAPPAGGGAIPAPCARL